MSARFLTDGISGRCVIASCLGEVREGAEGHPPFEEAQEGEGKVVVAGGGR